MNNWREWCCMVLTASAAVLLLQTSGVSREDKPNFYTAAQNQFPTWDLNHDGVLTDDEILRAFENPRYRGRAAAAIAVLQQIETHHIGNHEPLESFTLSQFRQ